MRGGLIFVQCSVAYVFYSPFKVIKERRGMVWYKYDVGLLLPNFQIFCNLFRQFFKYTKYGKMSCFVQILQIQKYDIIISIKGVSITNNNKYFFLPTSRANFVKIFSKNIP